MLTFFLFYFDFKMNFFFWIYSCGIFVFVIKILSKKKTDSNFFLFFRYFFLLFQGRFITIVQSNCIISVCAYYVLNFWFFHFFCWNPQKLNLHNTVSKVTNYDELNQVSENKKCFILKHIKQLFKLIFKESVP